MKKFRFWISILLVAAFIASCAASPASRVKTEKAEMLAEQTEQTLLPVEVMQVETGRMIQAQAASQTAEANGLFRAQFEGDKVEGTAEVVDGKYRVKATRTDGEAWHIKLESNYPTTPGDDYRITYIFTSDTAGRVKLGDFREYPIRVGRNEVTGTVSALSGLTYLDLQLGMLSPFVIDFEKITVADMTDTATFTSILPGAISYASEQSVFDAHDDGYTQSLTRSEDGVTMTVNAVPAGAEVWKSKLFIRTGAVPEAGKRYRVSADVTSDQDLDFEICFNNDNVEKGYAALYGQHLSAGTATFSQTFSVPVTGFTAKEVVLQLMFGKNPAGSKVTVNSVQVEEIKDQYRELLPSDFALDKVVTTGVTTQNVPKSYKEIPLENFTFDGTDTAFTGHDTGYVIETDEMADGVDMRIVKAPENAADRGVWKAKLYVDTGVVPEAGQTYRVSFDLTPAANQAKYEICFDGNTEIAYGALYNRSLTAGTADHVSYTFNPAESNGKLVLRLQLGETDDASGNTYAFRNLKVEAMSGSAVSVLPESFSYQTGSNVREEHADGYEQQASASGSTVTLDISAVGGGEVWQSKLFLDTGVTLEEGSRYLVSVDASATTEMSFEIDYNRGSAEKGYGALYGQTLSPSAQTYASTIAAAQSGNLVVQFDLGASPAGNTVTVSNVKVQKVTIDSYTEAPVTVSYYSQSGNVTESHDEGYLALLESDGGTPVYRILRTPETRNVWNAKLFISTGVTPEAGKTYQITIGLNAANGQEFEVCYNGNSEKDYGALYGQILTSGANQITHTFACEEAKGELTICVQLGATAGNTISVTGLQIQTQTQTQGAFSEIPVSVNYYSSTGNVTESHDDGYMALLESQGGKPTYRILRTPETNNVWNAKLNIKTGFTPEAGKSYRVLLDLDAASGQTYEVCFNGNAEKDYGALYSQTMAAGTNHVTYTFSCDEVKGELTICLQLGATKGNTVSVGTLTIQSVESTYSWSNVLGTFVYPYLTEGEESHSVTVDAGYENVSVNLSASEGHDDGYVQTLSGMTLNVSAVPEDQGVWNSRVFVDTHMNLEPGVKYLVKATVSAEKGFGFEICYNNGSEDKGYGADYSPSVSDNGSVNVSYTIDVPEDMTNASNLVLKFQFGTTPAENVISISNVTLQKWVPEHEETVTETIQTLHKGSFDLWSDSGYTTVLSGENGACVTFTESPASSVWQTKLFANTGVTLEAGKTYRISSTIAASFGYEICYNDGGTEKGVLSDQSAAQYGLSGSQKVDYTVTPDHDANLVIQYSIGNAPTGASFTVSGIKVEVQSDTPDEQVTDIQSGIPSFSSNSSFTYWAADGYTAGIGGNSGTAKLMVGSVPDGQEVWKLKLFTGTGVTLEANKAYRISMSIQPSATFNYEVCFNDGDTEKGVGALYDLSGAQSIAYDVTPDADKNLVIQISAGNAPAGSTVTVSGIKVEVWSDSGSTSLIDVPCNAPLFSSESSFSFWGAEGYTAGLTGSESSATLLVGSVPSGQEVWKLKLFTGTLATLEANKPYRISLNVQPSATFDYEVCFNDGDTEKGVGALYNQSGEQTIVYDATPDADKNLVIQISAGNAPAGSTVSISGIKLETAAEGTPGENLCTTGFTAWSPVNFWAHEDYAATASNTDSSASLTISSVPDNKEAWKVKLFTETGAELKAGKTYQISMKVSADAETGFEVCYNNGASEAALGGEYGLTTDTTVTHTVTPEADATLILQCNLGNAKADTTVTISDVEVEEISNDTATNVLPDSIRFDSQGYIKNFADTGYVTELQQNTDSATLYIHAAPSERHPWNVKLQVQTGFTPEKSKGYRVSFDLEAAKPQGTFEVFYDGSTEAAYGQLTGKSLAKGNQTVSYIINPGQSKGELILQLRVGQTNGTDGNTYTVRNIKIEEVAYELREVEHTSATVTAFTHETYQTNLEKAPKEAKMRIVKAPETGAEAWKVKLFVTTGTKLKAEQKYRIRIDVKAEQETGYEVCFNNGGEEKGLGAMYGLNAYPETRTVEYAVYAARDTDLVLQLSLGNCAAPNTITISDVRVEKAGAMTILSETEYTFR